MMGLIMRIRTLLGLDFEVERPAPDVRGGIELTGVEHDHTKRAWGNNLEVLRAEDGRLIVAGFHPAIDTSRLRLIPGGGGASATFGAIDFAPGDVLLLPPDLRIPTTDGQMQRLANDGPLRAVVHNFARTRVPDQWLGTIELLP